MYNVTLSLTSALDWSGCSTPRPGQFTVGKHSVPIAYEAVWAPEPIWTAAKNLALGPYNPHKQLKIVLRVDIYVLPSAF